MSMSRQWQPLMARKWNQLNWGQMKKPNIKWKQWPNWKGSDRNCKWFKATIKFQLTFGKNNAKAFSIFVRIWKMTMKNWLRISEIYRRQQLWEWEALYIKMDLLEFIHLINSRITKICLIIWIRLQDWIKEMRYKWECQEEVSVELQAIGEATVSRVLIYPSTRHHSRERIMKRLCMVWTKVYKTTCWESIVNKVVPIIHQILSPSELPTLVLTL